MTSASEGATLFPIAEAVQSHGGQLSNDTKEWMERFAGVDLDDASKYQFRELSGSTSINLKIEKIDTSDPKGYKSRGSFVTRNSSANPDVEAAAYNLSVLLGFDSVYRPAAKYGLGPKASLAFKQLLVKTNFTSPARVANKNQILLAISKGPPLPGVLKAKKDDTNTALDSMADSHGGSNGGPSKNHPIFRFLQASNPQPAPGRRLELKTGYDGDELDLVLEYSIIMLIDAITQQWDRYSGGNIAIKKDSTDHAHFYATDNGGADFSDHWSGQNLNWFSRYDRRAIDKLTAIKTFLDQPSVGFLGYTDATKFIVDLGLDTQKTPPQYLLLLRRNIGFVLDRIQANHNQFGEAIYLPN